MSVLIHVFDDTPHHYKPMESFFSEQCTLSVRQEFWVKKGLKPTSSEKFKTYESATELVHLLSRLPSNHKILFHGLFDFQIWRKLIFSSVVKRCSCVMWGAELYRHGESGRSLKSYISQVIHGVMVARFNSVFALTPGDAELVTQYLKRKKVDVLPYPLIGINKNKVEVNSLDENQPLKILIGNSAAQSNEHRFAFKILAHLADENIQIIVPLNYGAEKEYIDEVVELGSNIFGNKFQPITNMLSKAEYDELLVNVDMSVFSHQRQQGLYVAYSMLLMGKAMFLRSSISSFSNFTSLKFKVYATEDLQSYSFKDLCTLAENKNLHNVKLINSHFTEAALAPKWNVSLSKLVD